ncbi:MAG: LpqB family beta-propeller domain-containing protein, partial [Lewinella sp.]
MKFTLFFLLVCGTLTAQDLYFVDEPTLTPDGSEIIFSYNQDLWRVPAAGGMADRITALEGNETNPSISPDGQYLAFSGNQYGNLDVYLMPLAGGAIRQLTYHEADDKVESWSWDNDRIYFTSGRDNRMSTYTVTVQGGTPRRHFGENYFNTVHNAVEHPDGSIYFNESWESSLFVHRKRYRGPFNPEIKRYDAASDTYSKLTDWEGKDMLPVIDREGEVYFVSDRDNEEYNLYRLTEGGAERLVDSEQSIFSPAVSADGSRLAYIKNYQLYTFDPASGQETKVPVTVSGFESLAKQQDFKTGGNITAFDVAHDGKKIAFVSRGELFVADEEGKFIRQLQTGPGRVREVKWLKDNLTLLFNQTVDGYLNWFTLPADGSGEMTQRTDDDRNNRSLV